MHPRINLRRVRPDDAEMVAQWRAEPSARRYQPLQRRTVKELRDMLTIRGLESISSTAIGEFQWIVETPRGDAGWVTIPIVSRKHGTASLGYTIAESHRGRGYATAAVRAVLPFVFGVDKLSLFRLEAVAAIDNMASRRVLERCGFQLEGIARAYLLIDGLRVDHARYALLRPDWQATMAEPAASSQQRN
ncbi:MAG: GNAT family N-acetyltransferase [Thermomicrobiales bacterium]